MILPPKIQHPFYNTCYLKYCIFRVELLCKSLRVMSCSPSAAAEFLVSQCMQCCCCAGDKIISRFVLVCHVIEVISVYYLACGLSSIVSHVALYQASISSLCNGTFARTICWSVCLLVGRSVCLSVHKVYCGKMVEWIWMPFETVSGVEGWVF